jgi:hypothetical protein
VKTFYAELFQYAMSRACGSRQHNIFAVCPMESARQTFRRTVKPGIPVVQTAKPTEQKYLVKQV